LANAVVEGLQTNLEGMEVNEEMAAEEVAAGSDEKNRIVKDLSKAPRGFKVRETKITANNARSRENI
jgi:hypothetical protein